MVVSFKKYLAEAEWSKLKPSDLRGKVVRFDAFVEKIKSGKEFSLMDGTFVVLDKSNLDALDPDDATSFPSAKEKKTWKIKGGGEVPLSKMSKTADFGGMGGNKTPSGEDWEALIVVGVAVNNGVSNLNTIPEFARVEKYWVSYGKHAIKLGKTFKKELGVKTLSQSGSKTAKISSSWKEWGGKNATSKTDMLGNNAKIKISLKKKGNSQLMSGKAGEAIATFQAAMSTYSTDSKGEAAIIDTMDSIKSDMGQMSEKDTITSIKNLRDFGKKLSPSDQAKIKEMESLHSAADMLSDKLDKLFKGNPFKSHFCWEAATGSIKFKNSPDAIANRLVAFAETGQITQTMVLDSIDGAGSKLATYNNFYVSFKSSSGSAPYLALRTRKVKPIEESYLTKKRRNPETFASIVKSECSKGFLAEDVELLNEFQLFDKLKKSVKGVSSKIISQAKKILSAIMARVSKAFEVIKKFGSRMLNSLLSFFGLGVEKVTVKSGGPFPL